MSIEKCSVDGDIVKPCNILESSTEYGNPRGKQKGIYEWRYVKVNDDSGSNDRVFYGAKSGEHTETGVTFNFCPFCGVDISSPLHCKQTKQTA